MATDLISAGRAIGHPGNSDIDDPRRVACAWKRQRRSQESSEESEEEQYHDTNEYHHTEDSNDEDDDNSLEEDHHLSEVSPATSLERRRSLQLEKSLTMDCIKKPVRQNSAFTEMRSHSSRMSLKFLKTVIWLPTDLTLSLSKGFHNAPKLYHDRMVKSTPKVIGFRSGVKAAGTVCGTPEMRAANPHKSDSLADLRFRNCEMDSTTVSQGWLPSHGTA